MIESRSAIELTFRLKPDTALAARLTTSVMQSRTSLVASNCYREDDTLVYRVVSEKPMETDFWLREAGFVGRQDPVVLVDMGEEARALNRIRDSLALAGITVLHSYSSVEARGHTVAVFKTTDDTKALEIIQQASRRMRTLELEAA